LQRFDHFIGAISRNSAALGNVVSADITGANNLDWIEISGPQGVQATFDWQAGGDSTVGRMCTATLVNDVETY